MRRIGGDRREMGPLEYEPGDAGGCVELVVVFSCRDLAWGWIGSCVISAGEGPRRRQGRLGADRLGVMA